MVLHDCVRSLKSAAVPVAIPYQRQPTTHPSAVGERAFTHREMAKLDAVQVSSRLSCPSPVFSALTFSVSLTFVPQA